jgi:isocitrate dehydrogenase kinase/phosphatase
MKSIAEWQKAFKAAADQKFPDANWDDVRRTQSIQEQLDDVKVALQVERGEHTSDNHAHTDANHRIGALVADILILAEQRGADVEMELEKALAWFEGRT